MEAEEDSTATLHCLISKPDAPVKWRRGSLLLHPCKKYEIKQKDLYVELLIRSLKLEDAGEYSCDSGDQQTTAILKVKGRIKIIAYNEFILLLVVNIFS